MIYYVLWHNMSNLFDTRPNSKRHVRALSFIISFSFITYLGLFTFYSIFEHLSHRMFFGTWQKFSKIKCLLCTFKPKCMDFILESVDW